MVEVEYSKRVQFADKWSWVASTLVTVVFFSISLLLTLNAEFSAVAAAGVGIGMQYLLPYYASITVPAEQRQSIEDHPTADNFHHGAVGGGLLTGSLLAFAVMYFMADSTTALLIGCIWAIVSFALLKRRLPRR